MEANRFARHELKNGVLAAIGLLDYMRDMYGSSSRHEGSYDVCEDGKPLCFEIETPAANRLSATSSRASSSSSTASDMNSLSDLELMLNELDGTMQDMLDTVLDETMAREIVHGEYERSFERVCVVELFMSIKRTAVNDRFTVSFDPIDMPALMTDRHLWRYIYRNAVSNACKYGDPLGHIHTSVRYIDGSLEVRVTNQPGPNHEKLVKLSFKETSRVFDAKVRLEAATELDDERFQAIHRKSSGNGAWIMRKCSESLGGSCSIKFTEDDTEFFLPMPCCSI